MSSKIKHIIRHNSIVGCFVYIPRKLRIALYGILPRLIKRRVREVVNGGSIILTPKNIGIPFEANPCSDIAIRIITTGEYEPEFTKAIQCISSRENGGTIINVGANVGIIALHLARLHSGSKVIAIEPNPEAFQALKRNIVRNGFEKQVEAVQCCAGEKKGLVQLTVIPDRSEYSSINGIVHPAVVNEKMMVVEVPMLRLDDMDFNGQNINILIIDTEGAEGGVIRGSLEIIRKYNPIIMFECEDRLLRKFGDSANGICDLLKAEGYMVRNALFTREVPTFPFEGEIVAFPKRYAGSTELK